MGLGEIAFLGEGRRRVAIGANDLFDQLDTNPIFRHHSAHHGHRPRGCGPRRHLTRSGGLCDCCNRLLVGRFLR